MQATVTGKYFRSITDIIQPYIFYMTYCRKMNG